MKYWFTFFLITLQICSSSATKPNELEEVFIKFCNHSGGTIVPSEYIGESLEYLGINLPSFLGKCWTKQNE